MPDGTNDAAIDDPQTVAFVREQLRVVANSFLTALRTADVFAKNIANPDLGVLEAIPNDETIIDDGALADGRPIVRGRHVHRLADMTERIRQFADAPDAQGNEQAFRNALIAVAVTGRSLI